MVVLQEFFAAELVIVKHLLKQTASPARAVFLEGDERGAARLVNHIEVIAARVALVSANRVDLEVLGDPLHKRREVRTSLDAFIEQPNLGVNAFGAAS